MKQRLASIFLVLASPAFAAGEAVTFAGPGLELVGRLYRPEGPGPFPAFVLMHGCNGLWQRDGREPTALYSAWAEHWRQRGYVALLVDSFGPRGQREICTQRHRAITPERDRPRDAYAALQWLAGRPDVDSGHIHLQGWSNGAMAVLNTVKEGAPGRPAAGPEFRSAVAFYPGCAQLVKESDYRPRVPLLIQAGGADDWTPAAHCLALVEKFGKRGAAMDIDVYPAGHHGFDGAGGVHFRPEVRNPSSPTGWGASVGGNPEARELALRRTTDWVEAHNH